MRHALIIAGGSGTRLWPMSRAKIPKQLIPFIRGKSLLQLSIDRLEGLVEPSRRWVCAGESHRAAITQNLTGFDARFYLGEPMGRDTLNAVGLAAAVIAKSDPAAVIAVFTADHVIEPIDQFQACVAAGFKLAEAEHPTLVTFGIRPTHPATGYGYLQLGDAIPDSGSGSASGGGGRRVIQFKEKPDPATARAYLDAGPAQYLWNSGMFVWRATTLLDCIRRYAPENHAGLSRIADAWATSNRTATLAEVYPTLKKISVDFAIMEPASRDATVTVAAVPMELSWLDVGSWPAFAHVCERDEAGNAVAAERHLLLDCRDTLAASSDPDHLITAIGCQGLVIIHTPDATLVCPADRAEEIKKLHALAGDKFGPNII